MRNGHAGHIHVGKLPDEECQQLIARQNRGGAIHSVGEIVAVFDQRRRMVRQSDLRFEEKQTSASGRHHTDHIGRTGQVI